MFLKNYFTFDFLTRIFFTNLKVFYNANFCALGILSNAVLLFYLNKLRITTTPPPNSLHKLFST